MSDEVDKPQDADLVAHIADASGWYRHAEVIVQQRLYNFLMAASILILAAATSLSANAHMAQRTVVLTVSVVGLLLSVAYAVLGHRQKLFVDLHMDILEDLEGRLINRKNQVITQIARLRAGETAQSPTKGNVRALNAPEKLFRSSNLLSIAPLAFAFVFLTLAYLGYQTPPFKVA